MLYFVFSVIMVDNEGLNIRSLRVSMRADGAVTIENTIHDW
jgi:hypothetical protein